MFGVLMPERVSRLIEAVEIIRRLWTEQNVTHSGRHWQFSDVTIAPRPLQSPRPPIVIGARWMLLSHGPQRSGTNGLWRQYQRWINLRYKCPCSNPRGSRQD
jgi:hypothetical protein